MPGRTSYYSRLRSLVGFMTAQEWDSPESLIIQVNRAGLREFFYDRWDSATEQYAPVCSETAVRNTIQLAEKLDLISSERPRLTPAGEKAADPAQFDNVLKRGIVNFLSRSGCALSDLTLLCHELIQRTPPVLPTGPALFQHFPFDESSTSLGEKEFVRALRLLAQSGGISLSRKHLFFGLGTRRG